MRLAVLCNLSYFWVGLSASRIHHLVERLIFEQSSRFEVETLITFCVRRKMPVNIAPHICSRIASITLAGMQDGACRASWPDSLYIRHWEPCDHITISQSQASPLSSGWWVECNVRAEYEHTGTFLLSCELSSILTLAVLLFALICRF